MNRTRRFLRHIWPWLRWCVLGATLLLGVLAGLVVYVLFFATPDHAYQAQAWPPDQARIQALEPVFSWPETDAPEYLFELHGGGAPAPPIWTHRTNQARVEIPYGLLEPNHSYRWLLYPVNGRGETYVEPSYDRRFRTPTRAHAETFWNPVEVYPARLSITPQEMLNRLSIEISHDGPWRASLPDALVFADGEKHLSGRGTTVLNFYFDQGRAPGDPGRWGPIKVWAGGRVLEVPLVPGTRPDESWYQGIDPGFNPYLDTPSFANFEGSLFSQLTQGTCVGIALVVKLFFERVEFGLNSHGIIQGDFLTATRLLNSILTTSRISVRSSTDFRDLSSKQPDLVMGLMSALHFENLNPQHLRETLRALLGQTDDTEVERELWDALAHGKLPLVAGFRIRARVFKLRDSLGHFSVLDAGHAFIVYRGWRYGDATVFAVYDPNFEYRTDYPRRTTLVFFRDGPAVYFVGNEAQRDLVRFVPMETGRVFTFFAMMGHGAQKNLAEVRETLGDLFRSLPLE